MLVALVGNVASREGLALIEAAERMDRRRLGKCVVYDADVDALTLLDWAKDEGASTILVVFPSSGMAREPGVYHVSDHAPLPERSLETSELVRDIWMNLTGSLMPNDYVRALRVLSNIPFSVYECTPRNGDCIGVLEEWLGEVCLDKDSGNGK
ncbi:MAG: hypothetical protein F7C34_05215 [Desulfurococcales archaeon]|nr:hypothetical protein [Desulfurococcales archaeon]